MKFIKFLSVLWFLIPCVAFSASNTEFQNASSLLSAARRGDTQTVQSLINRGVDVNYVDSTGLSLVCTAVMNNDTRAIQILQMYGADSSTCDRQIKVYKQKAKVAANGEEYGFFSGLSSTHVIALSAAGGAAVIGGVALLTKAFDKSNSNGGSGSSGDRPNNNDSEDSTTSSTKLFAQNLPYGPACDGTTCPTDFTTWEGMKDFTYMSDATTKDTFNYLMVAHAYDAFVRGYLGMSTIRISSDKSPFNLSLLPVVEDPSTEGAKTTIGGGAPINVAMVTASGVNASGSAVDGVYPWIDASKISNIQSICETNGNTSAACQKALAEATHVAHKYFNYTGTSAATDENNAFNLSGSDSVFNDATYSDTKLAKIIAGWEEGGRSDADFYGFIPNGQLSVYKIGTGSTDVSDYKNYAAIYDALSLMNSGSYVSSVVANLALPAESVSLSYANVDGAAVLNNLATTYAAQKAAYSTLIDKYYNLNTSDDTSSFSGASGVVLRGTQSENASLAFSSLYKNQKHIWVNPAGHTSFDVDSGNVGASVATFENFAPAVYNDLENLFMTVVAVKPANGTSGATIDGYSAKDAGKLELAVWKDSDSNFYQSRICGLTGTGNSGALNPWCFAAPGTTDLEATASMAGSIALVKSAFDYMTPNQIFLLLALTADGPYLGTNPETNLAWTSKDALIEYLKDMYSLPANSDSSQYLESFKQAFGYGMINLERATRPSTNVYFYSSDTDKITSSSGNAYWRNATTSTSSSRASTVFSLTSRNAVKLSFYDVIESADGSISLPRVWNASLSSDNNSKHGLYMGDVLADFNVDSTNKRHNEVGSFSFDMSMSTRAYNDNMNGLDNLRVAFNSEKYDIDAEYQHHLTDGESRFDGRANGLLSLVSNTVSAGAKYKVGKFGFKSRAFSGTVTDENLLEMDPVVSSQFEPGHLGFASGAAFDTEYVGDTFAMDVSFGNMHETNTVLGMASDGLLSLRGGNTLYIDTVATYTPVDNLKLSMRATFADTRADIGSGMISELSNIKSNAFAFGLDMGNFSFTASMPLAVVNGQMGYNYADLNVVEENGKYVVEAVNPHIEYIDLSSANREKRFAGSYKHSVGEFTDAGIGFIYRVNPNNTDVFGNESILMFKVHHRLGI